jgi:hypothetical protein
MGSAATCPNQPVTKTSVPESAKGETSGKTPTKYLGQWDAALGCIYGMGICRGGAPGLGHRSNNRKLLATCCQIH